MPANETDPNTGRSADAVASADTVASADAVTVTVPPDGNPSFTATNAPDSEPAMAGPSGRARWLRFLLGVCVLYTVLTVISGTIALASGQQTDTHVHLLLRLLFVVLGLGVYELVATVRQRSPQLPLALVVLLGSATLLGAVLTSLFVSAQAGLELHPDAYRDAALNVAAVGLGLTLVSALVDLVRRRR